MTSDTLNALVWPSGSERLNGVSVIRRQVVLDGVFAMAKITISLGTVWLKNCSAELNSHQRPGASEVRGISAVSRQFG
jgi:hypothetical protein